MSRKNKFSIFIAVLIVLPLNFNFPSISFAQEIDLEIVENMEENLESTLESLKEGEEDLEKTFEEEEKETLEYHEEIIEEGDIKELQEIKDESKEIFKTPTDIALEPEISGGLFTPFATEFEFSSTDSEDFYFKMGYIQVTESINDGTYFGSLIREYTKFDYLPGGSYRFYFTHHPGLIPTGYMLGGWDMPLPISQAELYLDLDLKEVSDGIGPSPEIRVFYEPAIGAATPVRMHDVLENHEGTSTIREYVAYHEFLGMDDLVAEIYPAHYRGLRPIAFRIGSGSIQYFDNDFIHVNLTSLSGLGDFDIEIIYVPDGGVSGIDDFSALIISEVTDKGEELSFDIMFFPPENPITNELLTEKDVYPSHRKGLKPTSYRFVDNLMNYSETFELLTEFVTLELFKMGEDYSEDDGDGDEESFIILGIEFVYEEEESTASEIKVGSLYIDAEDLDGNYNWMIGDTQLDIIYELPTSIKPRHWDGYKVVKYRLPDGTEYDFVGDNIELFLEPDLEGGNGTITFIYEEIPPKGETVIVEVEKIIEVPVENIVEIEKIIEVPIETIIEKIIEIPIETIIEKITEVPVETIVEVEKIVKSRDKVEKIIEVPIEKIVEKIIEVPVNVSKYPIDPLTNELIFYDVLKSNWYYNNVYTAVINDITNGFADLSYRPTDLIKEKELLALLLRADGFVVNEFVDDWTKPYYEKLKKDSFFGKDKVLTREEAAYFIANYFGLSTSNDLVEIPDINQINPEYRESIKALYEHNIIRGVSESGIFNPKSKLNKAEASSIISNIIKNRH
ncbi:hypothetical protein J2Z35_002026 [Acetoanaerobium pronyense]|uniref:SLH domain-containing protein n=1 Tax=Acetoanaerobium pronyense TaxID=1482736 RepID=A0ABS4KKB6_9FIRM|nr:S-layer homology domain-containing protein [Acetoanaerobium pronyense]MBP2028225.1 hypothetical protein [Acetoanaerobium pronyense]